MEQKKEQYVQPVVVKHELLRDITAGASGTNGNHVCTPGPDCIT